MSLDKIHLNSFIDKNPTTVENNIPTTILGILIDDIATSDSKTSLISSNDAATIAGTPNINEKSMAFCLLIPLINATDKVDPDLEIPGNTAAINCIMPTYMASMVLYSSFPSFVVILLLPLLTKCYAHITRRIKLLLSRDKTEKETIRKAIKDFKNKKMGRMS